MPYTKRDWQIEFDEQQYIDMQGASFQRILARPSGRADWETALAEARTLIEPAATWDFFPIKEILHEHVVLANRTRIGGGPVTSVVGGAEELAVAVCTIGPAISRRVSEHQRTDTMLRAWLLDDLGSWAVDMVRQQLCRWLEQESAGLGLHVSTSLSPGESEWPVTDQATIFSLLDTGPIGVTLTPSMLMLPVKSLSLILGRGAQPVGQEGGSNCDFCSIRERCAYRARRVAASA